MKPGEGSVMASVLLSGVLVVYLAYLSFGWSRELQARIYTLEFQVQQLQIQCSAEPRKD